MPLFFTLVVGLLCLCISSLPLSSAAPSRPNNLFSPNMVRVQQRAPPAASTTAATTLRLNNFFSSNMVLQRTQQAVMWGYGVPGTTVTVRLDGNSVATAIVNGDSDWKVTLPATDASFNRNISASDGTTTVNLTNVAFGDVYLCSGQSNMQIALNYSFHGPEAMARAAQYSNIRLFSMWSYFSSFPVNESQTLQYSPNSWALPANATLQFAQDPSNPWGVFSATCYWTAMYLSDSLNHTIPIGLVQSSYGGTMVEAWTSPDTNIKCGPLTFPPTRQAADNASIVYNAMIHPLLPMRFTAVLWYQGESNWYNADRYACAFPNMIDDWRTKFNYPILPFYFVILSPYAGADPYLRQAQLAAWPKDSVGVASAIDLGDRYGSTGDIHPRNKSYVGERLARWLRYDIYGQKAQVSTPLGPEPVRDTGAISVVTTSDGSVTNVSVVVTYNMVEANHGLYTLPSPDCTTCCTGGAGLLLVTVNDTAHDGGNRSTPLVSTYRPSVVIDQNAFTLTTTFIVPTTLSSNANLTIGLEAEDWPQCILYNRHSLPALPFIITLPAGGGSGGSADEESSSHLILYAGLIVIALLAIAVVAWLALRYRKQRAASSGAEDAGYRDIDERRTGLLNDRNDSSM